MFPKGKGTAWGIVISNEVNFQAEIREFELDGFRAVFTRFVTIRGVDGLLERVGVRAIPERRLHF